MKKKILILANNAGGLYNFRKELLERLITEEHEVIVSVPYAQKEIGLIEEIGCVVYETELNRHGINPIEELKLLAYYNRLIKNVEPDVILTYTIKPNIYGGIIAKKYNISHIANITGLGTALEKTGIQQKSLIYLYKYAFSNIQTVFFQNKENRQFFIDNDIVIDKHKLIPGSGVNLKYFYMQEYPLTVKSTEFVFISRIMKEKGINQYLEAAKYITRKYPNTKFHICGSLEGNYQKTIKKYQKNNIIEYHGKVTDIREVLKHTHCTVHPTYYPEGMSNVLLESAASGRPIISTNRSGTREIIDDGINGYLINEKNTEDLIEKLELFLQLPHEKKRAMGIAGRKKTEAEFDRKIVVKAYLQEIING